mmetsp:Transcript_4900/g.16157  ORF Transcript_4900/g.16157 Transcript_4900/m.16157 type:complete len:230 (+) Transcript_4900:275-964(+)
MGASVLEPASPSPPSTARIGLYTIGRGGSLRNNWTCCRTTASGVLPHQSLARPIARCLGAALRDIGATALAVEQQPATCRAATRSPAVHTCRNTRLQPWVPTGGRAAPPSTRSRGLCRKLTSATGCSRCLPSASRSRAWAPSPTSSALGAYCRLLVRSAAKAEESGEASATPARAPTLRWCSPGRHLSTTTTWCAPCSAMPSTLSPRARSRVNTTSRRSIGCGASMFCC